MSVLFLIFMISSAEPVMMIQGEGIVGGGVRYIYRSLRRVDTLTIFRTYIELISGISFLACLSASYMVNHGKYKIRPVFACLKPTVHWKSSRGEKIFPLKQFNICTHFRQQNVSLVLYSCKIGKGWPPPPLACGNSFLKGKSWWNPRHK